MKAAAAARDHAQMAVFTLVWASNFVLAEWALRDLSPVSFSVSRFLAATAALFALGAHPALQRDDRGHTGRTAERPIYRARPGTLLAVALLGVVVAPWLGIEGLARTHAGRAAIYVSIAPALSLLVQGSDRWSNREDHALAARASTGRQRSALTRWTGALLIIGGAGLMVAGPELGAFSWGDLLLLLASVCAVVELHLMRRLALDFGPARASAYRTGLGGLLYLALASPWLLADDWLRLTPLTWVAIVAGGTIGLGLGQWVKARALRTLGPTRVLAYFNLVPVVTLGLRAWLSTGVVTSVDWVAGLVIVVGASAIQAGDGPRAIGPVRLRKPRTAPRAR